MKTKLDKALLATTTQLASLALLVLCGCQSPGTYTGPLVFIAPPPPIIEAAHANNLEQVKALVQENPSVVSSKDSSSGLTPLDWAAVNGNEQMVEFLLANGAEVDARSGGNGWTALHYAANHDSIPAAQILLAHGANVNAKGTGGETPLYRATWNGHTDMVNWLRQHGGTE